MSKVSMSFTVTKVGAPGYFSMGTNFENLDQERLGQLTENLMMATQKAADKAAKRDGHLKLVLNCTIDDEVDHEKEYSFDDKGLRAVERAMFRGCLDLLDYEDDRAARKKK